MRTVTGVAGTVSGARAWAHREEDDRRPKGRADPTRALADCDRANKGVRSPGGSRRRPRRAGVDPDSLRNGLPDQKPAMTNLR